MTQNPDTNDQDSDPPSADGKEPEIEQLDPDSEPGSDPDSDPGTARTD